MLEKLLSEIRQIGIIQPTTLAARLDISPELVEMMLTDLKNMGYISETEICAQTACHACNVRCSINAKFPAQIWEIRGCTPASKNSRKTNPTSKLRVK